MKISTRLTWNFGAVVVLGVLVAALGAFELGRLRNDLDLIANDRMLKVELLTDIKDNLNTGARSVRNLMIAPESSAQNAEQARILEAREKNSALFAQLRPLIKLPEALAKLQAIEQARQTYNASVDRVVKLALERQHEGAILLLRTEVRQQQAVLFAAIDDLRAFQKTLTQQTTATAQTTVSQAVWIMLSLCGVMAGAGLFFTRLTTHRLMRDLGAEPTDLAHFAQRVADGDLTAHMAVQAGDSRSVLAVMAKMQTALTDLVARVRQNAESLSVAAAEIAEGNTNLSTRTENQASALEETAASMEQLGSTVKHNAESARQTNQLAQHSATIAVQGGRAVSQVVQTMRDIHHSSQKIADIIGVIDGIAFQTNILALNAAVEAARAGEQGRGFAVVASEVRSLAQRSAEAAREIKALITSSVQRVDQGTAQVDQAGQTIDEVVTSIRRVNEIMGEISAASSQQSQGVSQVVEAVSEMDQVTQQNAALVEEMAAYAINLRTQAEQLVQAVGIFKINAQSVGVGTGQSRS